MNWSARRLFEWAGILFLVTMVLHGVFDIRAVHTLNNMVRMSVGSAGTSFQGLAGVTWYQGVFEPILVGMVGFLVGLALGRAADALRGPTPSPEEVITPTAG